MDKISIRALKEFINHEKKSITGAVAHGRGAFKVIRDLEEFIDNYSDVDEPTVNVNTEGE